VLFYLSKIIFSGFLQFKGNFLHDQNTGRLFATSLFTHVKEKASKESAKHMGVGGDICKQSEQEK